MRLPLTKLPAPPSLEELRAHTPRIGPASEAVPRPFWSVMIPTYNSGEYLHRTLASVLCQDPGPERMQIEVVDGCSTVDKPEEIANELGRGRVTFSRIPENRGPATTFNACIERARGHWVHILHGDDLVLPGFYEAYAAAIGAFPQAQTVVGQAMIIDEHDLWGGIVGPRPPVGGGILGDFVERVATDWLVACPSVVVNRTAYEKVGGYCTFFRGPNDWDMWLRLALHAPVACVARPYSLYRHRTDSQTKQLTVTGANVLEECMVVGANLARIDQAGRTRPIDTTSWRALYARWSDSDAWEQDKRNNTRGRYIHARWAWILDPSATRLIMLLKSWLKHKLAGSPVAERR